MNRANQLALFQQTNQGLLNIRQLELNYYINLNIAFGTQAALIGGFTYGVFTQNQYNEDIPYAELFQNIYWVTSAGTIAASVHVIITTMLLQVLGPGLALHGPIGSMTRATEGMRIEQKPIITSFIIMMFLFALSTVLSFWAVMSFESSVGASAVFLISGRYWWYYCERIYLRFYWEIDDSFYNYGNHPNDDPLQEDYDEMNPAEPQIPQHLRDTEQGKANGKDGGKTSKSNKKSQKGDGNKKKVTFFGRIFSSSKRSDTNNSKKNVNSSKASKYGVNDENPELTEKLLDSHKDGINEEEEALLAGGRVTVPPIFTSKKNIAMEGYLLKKGHPHFTGYIIEIGKEWERRYFVLHVNGHIYYYTNRQTFRNDPKSPIYNRPLNLPDFGVDIFNSEFGLIRRDSGVLNYTESASHISENDLMNAAFPGMSKRATSLNNAITTTIQGNNTVNTGTPQKGDKRFCFQITLTPKENDDTMDRHSDVDSTRGSDVGHGQKKGREPWVLRCDTEEELEMCPIAMREVSPNSFKF